MQRPSRTSLVLAAVLACALVAPAAAAPRSTAGERRRDDALAAVARTRDLLATGRLADVVRAGASLRGVALDAPGRPTPVAVPRDVPAVLAPTVAALLGALARGGAEALASLPAGPAFARNAAAALAAGDARAIGALAHGVDEARLDAAALLVAATVDAALPALRAAAAAAPPAAAASGVVDGCDLVDQPGLLCLAGTGANRTTSDYVLQIDLGGNDEYRNAAGGADPTGSGIAAAAAIDLGGDDTYAASLPTATGARAAQGGVNLGGIGFLVDTTGNDRYRVESVRADTSAHGHGFAFAGVAVLADATGNDSYTLAYIPPSPGATRPAYGMGFSSLAGVGALVDGAGNDTYLVRAQPVPTADDSGIVAAPRASLQGIGVGVAGAGIVSDGGGADAFTLEAVGETDVAPAEGDGRRPTAGVQGLGVGEVAGAGLLLTGTGATTYTARATARGPESGGTVVEALGLGGLAGLGVVDDVGGDDTYVAETGSTATRSVTADACACPTPDATTVAGSAATIAVGFASLGATGLVHDANGADTYRTVATSRATSNARNEGTVPPPGADAAVAAANAGSAVVRGLGAAARNPSADVVAGAATDQLLEDGAAGLLLDDGGDDRYDAVATTRAAADALAAAGVAREHAATGKAVVEAQAMGGGGGYGELRDGGGADTYTSASTVEAVVAHVGTTTTGEALSAVQGSGPPSEDSSVPSAAAFVDVDGGATDRFSALPADPTCEGTRGQGRWRDCDSPYAGGVNS